MRKFTKSHSLFKKAEKVIPLASQTFSKSHLVYVSGAAPLFITHGRGSHVWDIDGHEYVDFVNGLLPVILGYQYPAVDQAIKRQLARGISFSLPSPLEYELARLIIKHVPGAEMVRFGKTGTDVTSAAVRLARAYTSREHVAVCGYHGWQDWYIGSTTRNLGVPECVRKLTHKFEYNNLDSLEKIFRQYKKQIAAVIMEPMNTEEPRDNFLGKVKTLCRKHGVLFIFDEMITGFRFSLGGAQKLFGVVPDISCFGKSIANGMPLSVLTGKKKFMKLVEDIFFSGSYLGETLSLAAAIATIKEMERKPVIEKIRKAGEYLQSRTRALISNAGLAEAVKLVGHPSWQLFLFSDAYGCRALEIKTYIQQEMLQAGFLWSGAHNMSYSHSQEDLNRALGAYRKIFVNLKRLLESRKLRQSLAGKPISDVFKIR